jgi:predicted outer membrane repeat protein
VYVLGTFTMNNGTISGNTSGCGGGVRVAGTFTMNGGTISGNTAGTWGGGGVYADTFIMKGGTISLNTSKGKGGGVYAGKSFTKVGTAGIIYGSNAADGNGNTASSDAAGHAVYVNGGKKRNTTARVATAMDSSKDGPAGGWE